MMSFVVTKKPSPNKASHKTPHRRKIAPKSVPPTATLFVQPKANCACGGGCPRCQDSAGHQRKATASQLLRSPGQPLDPATRALMEPRFGHDFSPVRVHTNRAAANSAQNINARAFTIGGNIAFAQGQFAPGTSKGQQLLAHELTHVVQQGFALPHRRHQNHVPMSASQASPGLIQRSIAVDSSKFTGKNASKRLADFRKRIIRELQSITGLSLSFVNNKLIINPKGKAKSKGSAKAAQILQLGVNAKRKIPIVPMAGFGGSHTPKGNVEWGTKTPSPVLKALSPGMVLLHELAHEFASVLKASDYDKRVADIRKKGPKATFREQAFLRMARPKQLQADENIPTEAMNIVRSELGLGIQRTGYWIPLQFPYRPNENNPIKRVTDYTQFTISGSKPGFLYLHPKTFGVYFSTVDFYKRPFEPDGFPPIAKPSEMKKVTQGSKVFKKLRKFFR